MTRNDAPSAVIFDFDGVLADTERLHLAAFQDVFEPRGWPLNEQDYVDRYMGFDDAGLFAAYAEDRGLALSQAALQSLMAEKSAAFRRRLGRGDVLYRGAVECIGRLAERFSLGVASGALRAEIADILSAAGVLPRFATIVGAEDVAAREPAPDPYLAAAAGLGVDPAGCVAIEDSRWGLESAALAGMRTIGITTTSPAGALAAAHRIVSHLDEVTVEAIEQLADRRSAW
jgi:HAD superfamily hydrolase (TIGR01509 family)